MGEKYKKGEERRGEEGGKKGSNLPYFFFRLVSPANPPSPPSTLSLSLSSPPLPQVPPPTVDNLVRRMTGQSSYSVSFADQRRYYFVL